MALLLGDALTLPFPNATFACATTGFGLRNVASMEQMLREVHRVLVPGGRFCVMETTPVPPGGVASRIFRFYFLRVVPLLGALLAGDREAYTYLPRSVEGFPSAEVLAAMMRQAGFVQVGYSLVGFGTVAIHQGIKG